MNRATRRGFSLLEVMIALAILTTSLVILMEAQTDALRMTQEADRIVVATNLAQEKFNEVQIKLEQEGMSDEDVCDEGDFKDFGDEQTDLEFGDSLEDYHYEWCVYQVDLQLAADIGGMAQNLLGSGYFGGGSSSDGASAAAAASGALPPGGDVSSAIGSAMGGGNVPDLSAFGLSPDMMSDMLGNYFREVRVRIWWGKDSKEAEDNGDEVVLTSHVSNPTGAVVQSSGGTESGTEGSSNSATDQINSMLGGGS